MIGSFDDLAKIDKEIADKIKNEVIGINFETLTMTDES